VTREHRRLDRPFVEHDDVSVEVSLRDRQGATLEKTVMYQVTLEPNLAVLRND